MIVVDTSALMAVVQREPAGEACVKVLEGEAEILLSAATLAEALIVAGSRRLGAVMTTLVGDLGCQVVPVTRADAVAAAQAYVKWGKGNHPAGLNYGDCFAYALASKRGCKLLFIGDDFSRTDIAGCLPAPG
jgi:ribonuclease VapC